MTAKIDIATINGTPVYAVSSFTKDQRRVYGGVFDPSRGRWYHPAFYPFHNEAIDDYNKLYTAELTPKATAHLAAQNAYTDALLTDTLDNDFRFVTTPDEYQLNATKHLVYNIRAGALLDCGLGKTKIIIDALRYLVWCNTNGVHPEITGSKYRPRVLCVVKSSVLWNWPEELAKHAGNEFSCVVVDGYSTSKKKAVIESAAEKDFLIITYEQAASGEFAEVIKRNFGYNTIVADESHKLQTWKSQNTQAAVSLAQKAYRRIIATGTATLGDPRHLYGQLHFLAPHLTGGSYFDYCNRYLQKAPTNNKIIVGYKNLKQLNDKIRKSSKIVRLDGHIKVSRTRVDIPVELSTEQSSLYDTLVKTHVLTREDTGELVEFEDLITRLTKAHQICNGFINFSNENPYICDGCEHVRNCIAAQIKPYTAKCKVELKHKPPHRRVLTGSPKLQALLDKLEDVLVEPTNAVIITYRFQADGDAIAGGLTTKGVNFLRILPGTSAKMQLETAAKFESDTTIRVYLAQISTLVGINLVRAKYIFFYSLSMDLKDYEQARGRNYRRTQTAPEVFEYIFYAKNSIESMIIDALETKSDIKETVLARVDCLSCARSVDDCRAKKILPWKKGCIYENMKNKQTISLEPTIK